MKAKYNYKTDRYVSDTFSDIGQIYLDGFFENNVKTIKMAKEGKDYTKIDFLGPI